MNNEELRRLRVENQNLLSVVKTYEGMVDLLVTVVEKLATQIEKQNETPVIKIEDNGQWTA